MAPELLGLPERRAAGAARRRLRVPRPRRHRGARRRARPLTVRPKLARLRGVVRRTVGDAVSATDLSPATVSADLSPEADVRRPVDWHRRRQPGRAVAFSAVVPGRDRHGPRLRRRRPAGRASHLPAGLAARRLRGRRGAARHRRPHAVVRRRRPRRGPAALRPAGRRHAPAAARAQRAGGRRGARPDRRRHPRARCPAAPEASGAARVVLGTAPLGWWPAPPGGRPGCSSRWPRASWLAIRPLLPRLADARSSRRWPGPTTPPPWRKASRPRRPAHQPRPGLPGAPLRRLSAAVHARFGGRRRWRRGSAAGPGCCCTPCSPPPP